MRNLQQIILNVWELSKQMLNGVFGFAWKTYLCYLYIEFGNTFKELFIFGYEFSILCFYYIQGKFEEIIL